jgi:hypothetical protein
MLGGFPFAHCRHRRKVVESIHFLQRTLTINLVESCTLQLSFACFNECTSAYWGSLLYMFSMWMKGTTLKLGSHNPCLTCEELGWNLTIPYYIVFRQLTSLCASKAIPDDEGASHIWSLLKVLIIVAESSAIIIMLKDWNLGKTLKRGVWVYLCCSSSHGPKNLDKQSNRSTHDAHTFKARFYRCDHGNLPLPRMSKQAGVASSAAQLIQENANRHQFTC